MASSFDSASLVAPTTSYAPRILVVEREGSTRDRLDRLFSEEGYFVAAVATAELAVGALRKSNFQVAILDFSDLDRDGIRLLTEIRAEFPRTKMIVMAPEDMADAVEAADIAQAVTTKKNPENVLNAVYRAIDSSGAWAASDLRIQGVLDNCLRTFREHPNPKTARFAAALVQCPSCTNRCPGIEYCQNLS